MCTGVAQYVLRASSVLPLVISPFSLCFYLNASSHSHYYIKAWIKKIPARRWSHSSSNCVHSLSVIFSALSSVSQHDMQVLRATVEQGHHRRKTQGKYGKYLLYLPPFILLVNLTLTASMLFEVLCTEHSFIKCFFARPCAFTHLVILLNVLMFL